MEVKTYRWELITTATQSTPPSAVSNVNAPTIAATVTKAVGGRPETTPAQLVKRGLIERGSDEIARAALGPLNSSVGNLALPVYAVGRSWVKGAGTAALASAAVGVAFQALQFGIQKLQERVAKMEAKADKANDRDNLLLRAGSKASATYYSGSLFGVKTNTSRG